MNKLYVIRFRLSNGYIVSTWSAWSETDVLKKMDLNQEWKFTLTEDNEIHKIWDAH